MSEKELLKELNELASLHDMASSKAKKIIGALTKDVSPRKKVNQEAINKVLANRNAFINKKSLALTKDSVIKS